MIVLHIRIKKGEKKTLNGNNESMHQSKSEIRPITIIIYSEKPTDIQCFLIKSILISVNNPVQSCGADCSEESFPIEKTVSRDSISYMKRKKSKSTEITS